MIIFDEKQRAKMLDEQNDKSISKIKDIMMLVKLYNSQNLNKDEIINKLSQKVNDKCYNKIDIAMDYCKNKCLKENKEIIIYKEELDVIQKEFNYDLQKLLFIMLCVCKFYNRSNKKDYLFISAGSETTLSKLSKLGECKFSRQDKKMLAHSLYEKKYIYPELGKVKLLYYKDVGTEVLKFIPYDTMIYEYKKYIGENVIRCFHCNKWIYKRGNKTKYCENCAKEISKEQRKEIMQNKRNNDFVTK